MTLQRWEPFREMRQMENAMNRLWRGFGGWQNGGEGNEQWSIPLDVVQKGDDVEVKASLPGIDPKNIDVAVEDNVLTIKAESATETESEEAGYVMRERAYGGFFRALRLPESIDPEKIKSTYENGVLRITMPKAEEKKRKQIKVNTSGGTKQIETKS